MNVYLVAIDYVTDESTREARHEVSDWIKEGRLGDAFVLVGGTFSLRTREPIDRVANTLTEWMRGRGGQYVVVEFPGGAVRTCFNPTFDGLVHDHLTRPATDEEDGVY